MSSIRDAHALMDKAVEWHQSGQQVALLTLIAVKGSAYRRPGARMVMAKSGHMLGTLSGGCLEGDLFAHAERAMETGLPSIQHYDLTEDAMWGLGIGCKGKIQIWIEPLNPEDAFWSSFHQRLTTETPTIFGGVLPSGGRFFSDVAGEWISRGSFTPEMDVLAVLGSHERTGRDGEVWWDILRPPERLVVAGAGHDAEPVARLAHQAGFDVVMLDPRDGVNNAQHFPGVTHVVKSARDVDSSELRDSFWIIMNHHQSRDEEALVLASQTTPRYVGVLGPRVRTREMLAKTGLGEAGSLPLHSPVGLDLGAETPEEVAISIVAELMAIRAGTTGGALHGRERIHR